jgi:hypothetical protein
MYVCIAFFVWLAVCDFNVILLKVKMAVAAVTQSVNMY